MLRHDILTFLIIMLAASLALGACEGNDYRSSARDAVDTGPVENSEPTDSTPATAGEGDHDSRPSERRADADAGTESGPRVEDGVAYFLGLAMDVPDEWTLRPPSNEMRAAEFAVPTKADEQAGDAEVIVYHFPGSGGSVDANIERWRQQFRPVDGRPPEPTVSEFEADGMAITLVELRGDHRPMLAETYNEDNILLSAIIDAPVGRTFIQFMGPSPTVGAWADNFEEMLRGMRSVE